MSVTDPFKIFAKEHEMHYYRTLSAKDRKLAWKHFETWKQNAFGDNTAPMYLHQRVVRPLLKQSYFCPISDKDLIAKILKPAANRQTDECFVMLRLSQNPRPLVWVCALGGTSKITRVRIGIPTPRNPKYTVMVKDRLAYQSTDIHVIATQLRIDYAPDCKTFDWSALYDPVS